MDFDVQDFLSKYPKFLDLGTDTINTLYITSKLLGRKVVEIAVSLVSRYEKPETYKNWSYLVLAHLCQIEVNQTVGRLSSANEGSVSGNFEMTSSESADFWNQTIYGSQCVQLLRTKPVFKYYF